MAAASSVGAVWSEWSRTELASYVKGVLRPARPPPVHQAPVMSHYLLISHRPQHKKLVGCHAAF